MTAVETITTKRTFEHLEAAQLSQAKRFKISELPLSAGQKAGIDGLVHTIKKRGIYDKLRHDLLAQFKESPEKSAFVESLNNIAEAEIERDPSYLSRNQRQAATLLQGVVDRSNVYGSVDEALERLITENINQIEVVAREIRSAEVGEEIASQEEIRGRKTDGEYAHEAAQRLLERAKVRKQEQNKQRREEEKEALRMKAEKQMKELEDLRRQGELLKRREQKKKEKLEHEAKKAAAAREAATRLQMIEQGRQVYQEREREQSAAAKEVEHSPATAAPVRLPTERELEEAALELLIKEGAELAAKGKKEPDPLEEPAPPHRQISISIPKGPAADRLRQNAKPPHPGPKLSYSSTHRDAPHIPVLPVERARDRTRSPYRRPSLPLDRTHPVTQHEPPSATSPHRGASTAPWSTRPVDSEEAKSVRRSRRDDYDDEHYSSSHRRDSVTRDNERGSSRHHDHDHDHDYERSERDYHRKKDRDSGRYDEDDQYENDDDQRHHRRDTKSRATFDAHTGRPRARIDDPPEHIDRYVPGKGTVSSSSGRNRDREGEKEYERGGYRERDGGRRRSGYDDRERDKYRERDREDYRDRDDFRGSGKERERDRGREKDYERPSGSHRPRRDPAPEKIDRYVPGA